MDIYSSQPIHNTTAGQAGNISGADSNATKSRQAGSSPVALEKGFGRLMALALQEPDRSAVIQAARQALHDGTLETDAAFEQAAETILRLGI